MGPAFVSSQVVRFPFRIFRLAFHLEESVIIPRYTSLLEIR